MSKKIKCAIYLRVSTQDQNTQLQRDDVLAYAHGRGWNDLVIYEDKASGINTQRPEFQKMMIAARSRKFDILLVWKFDRFARSLKDLVSHLHELSELNIALISIQDQVDLSTSTGRLIFQIIGAFAEFEASIIRERVRAGVKSKISKTGKWGPAKKRNDADVINLRRAGYSIREIAKRLNISSTSVTRSLKGVPGTP